MDLRASQNCTAFAGTERVASGSPGDVAIAAKRLLDRGDDRPLVIFDDATGDALEVDFRGTVQDVALRYAVPTFAELAARAADSGDPDTGVTDDGATSDAPRSPGRPKLGVVGREVTLLPRHWDWLATQPGGASVTLRKLVDAARRLTEDVDRIRTARDTTFRFISTIAGDAPGFEEAVRALYAGDRERFETNTASWPTDVREHARMMAADSFGE